MRGSDGRPSECVAEVHQKADQNKADRDAKRAEHHARDAEDDAVYAVQFVYAVIEEAESAVIDPP